MLRETRRRAYDPNLHNYIQRRLHNPGYPVICCRVVVYVCCTVSPWNFFYSLVYAPCVYVCYAYLTRVKRSHETRDEIARESCVRGHTCNFTRRFRSCRDSAWIRLATFASQKNSYRELLMLPTFRRVKLTGRCEERRGNIYKTLIRKEKFSWLYVIADLLSSQITLRHRKITDTRNFLPQERQMRYTKEIVCRLDSCDRGVHARVFPSHGKYVLRFFLQRLYCVIFSNFESTLRIYQELQSHFYVDPIRAG